MKKMAMVFRLSAVFVFLTVYSLSGQTLMALQQDPILSVSGTSSLHDWVMTSKKATGTLQARFTDKEISQINSIVVEMPSESLKSGKRGMDRNAYNALKTDIHKYVRFELIAADRLSETRWRCRGRLTIAGVSKTVAIELTVRQVSGAWKLEGSYACKLTDYDITPPTALMGTVKTGDEVTLNFQLTFKQ